MKPSELLKNSGWAKGTFCIYNGDKVCYCMLGAVRESIKDWREREEYSKLLRRIVFTKYGFGSVSHVNDWILKSKKEAVELLELTEEKFYAENHD